MQKFILSLASFFLLTLCYGVPNGDFSKWKNSEVPQPEKWVTPNLAHDGIADTVYKHSVLRSQNSYRGDYSLQLHRGEGVIFGSESPLESFAEISYEVERQIETIVFAINIDFEVQDTAIARVTAFRNGDEVGYGDLIFIESTDGFLQKNIEIDYEEELIPDSMEIFFRYPNTNERAPKEGNIVLIDDIHHGYATQIKTVDHEENINVHITPNPARDYLYLNRNQNLDSPPEVKLYNLQGQIVLSETMTNEQLDISALQKGMYLLEIKGENQKRFYERVVIE